MTNPALPHDLTIDEQVALTSGHDVWHTVRVDRLGVPSVRVTDGPTGARGPDIEGTDTSACFPVGTALAATWDLDLIAEVGRALASEARAKGAGVLLGPTVNLHRHPLAGRNFECYSEDPYLSARIAVAFVEALQAGGVGACIKHYVANDSEHRRHTMSSDVSERALRELYLQPFEAAVREAGTWSIMSAYNRINGTYASDHRWLLTTVLRDEWGFDGAVISDWGGTMSAEPALLAGLDLEMPGPGSKRGARLSAALAGPEGDSLTAPVATAAANVARLAIRAAAGEPLNPRLSDDEVNALTRRAAAQSMVLLTNDGLLPLDPGSTTVAVIGPNAEQAQIQGGGSSQVRPHHVISPLAGITARLGDADRVDFAQGCTRRRYTRPASGARVEAPEGGPGVRMEVFAGPGFDGEPSATSTVPSFSQRFFGGAGGSVDSDRMAVRLTSRFTPEVDGTHTVGVAAAGRATVLVDGVAVVEVSATEHPGETFFGWGSVERRGTVELRAGQTVDVEVEYQRDGSRLMGGVRVGIDAPTDPELLVNAVLAAAAADVAVVVVGLDGEWETEGADRVDMALPGGQDALVSAVAAANPKTIVVVNAGSPVLMPWLDEVAAVVQAWYPGQDFGTSLADVLFGDVDPSGRLPTTFPVRLEDAPSHANYPGKDDHLPYTDDVLMGYRGYDAAEVAPLFPFGHGLSYTTFAYGDLTVDLTEAGGLSLSVTVTNTGPRRGVEVVQLYVGDDESSVVRPPKELRGFRRLELGPGEETTATFDLGGRDLAFWDAALPGWRIEPGTFTVAVGSSSRCMRAQTIIEVADGSSWSASERPPV